MLPSAKPTAVPIDQKPEPPNENNDTTEERHGQQLDFQNPSPSHRNATGRGRAGMHGLAKTGADFKTRAGAEIPF